MVSTEAQRTLVKSPPELWAELSDADSLARHLGELGEIRVVRSEPETKIEWEGEGISGTVELKASGWGTKVTLTARREVPEPQPAERPEPEAIVEPKPVAEPEAIPEPEPVAEPEPEPQPGFFARLFRRRKPQPEPEPPVEVESEPVSQAEPAPAPEPAPEPDIAAELAAIEASMAAATTAALTAVLDRLGAAHHRPFSRA
jgi:hypothetical protein